MSNKAAVQSRLSDVIFYSIDKAIRSYRQYAQKQIRENGFDITIDQWLILQALVENPGIKQQDLAEMVFKDNASITRIIDLLVTNGYLDRTVHATDRRKTNLTITNKAENILDSMKPVIAANRRVALKDISAAEIQTVKRVLEQIAENCKR